MEKPKTCRGKGCKKPIEKGNFCDDCFKARLDDTIEKQTQKRLNKLHNTIEYGLSRVKEVADQRFWATSHKNCFRATFGPSESPKHINLKFEWWKYHRRHKRIVFCELQFKNGKGCADLVIVDKGFVWIEEIKVSESQKSIDLKREKYPFPLKVRTEPPPK